MNMINQFLLSIVLCCCIMFSEAYAKDASDQKDGRQKRMQEMVGKIYAQLNLTAEQKQLLEDNKQKQREHSKALYQQMKAQREALHQELMKADLDINKVNQIHAQLKAVKAQMMDERLNSILEVRKILTAQQFSQFLGLMEEQRSKRWDEGLKNGKS